MIPRLKGTRFLFRRFLAALLIALLVSDTGFSVSDTGLPSHTVRQAQPSEGTSRSGLEESLTGLEEDGGRRWKQFKRLLRQSVLGPDKERAQKQLLEEFGTVSFGEVGVDVAISNSRQRFLFSVLADGKRKWVHLTFPPTLFKGNVARLIPRKDETSAIGLDSFDLQPRRKFVRRLKWQDDPPDFVPSESRRQEKLHQIPAAPFPGIVPTVRTDIGYRHQSLPDFTGLSARHLDELEERGYLYKDEKGFVPGELVALIAKTNREMDREEYPIHVLAEFIGVTPGSVDVMVEKKTAAVRRPRYSVIARPGEERRLSRKDALDFVLTRRVKQWAQKHVGGFVRWPEAAKTFEVTARILQTWPGKPPYFNGVPLWVRFEQMRFLTAKGFEGLKAAEQKVLGTLRADEVDLFKQVYRRYIHESSYSVGHRYHEALRAVQERGISFRIIQHPLDPIRSLVVVSRSRLDEIFQEIKDPAAWAPEQIQSERWYAVPTVAKVLGLDKKTIRVQIHLGNVASTKLFDTHSAQRWVSGKELLRLLEERKVGMEAAGLEEAPAILGVADDQTGAREVAAEWRRRGVKVMVMDRLEDLDKVPTGYGVILNSRARSLEGSDAQERVSHLETVLVQAGQFPDVKVDSTMRGVEKTLPPIYRAFQEELDLIVFVSAYPSEGRVTKDGGIHYVDGKRGSVLLHESDYAKPPHSIPTSSLPELLASQLDIPREKVHVIPLKIVKQGEFAIQAAMEDLRGRWGPGLVVIPEATQQEDLSRIAAAVSKFQGRVLRVGSAGFLGALMPYRAGVSQAQSALEPFAPRRGPGALLALIGAINDRTNAQVQFARRRMGGLLQVLRLDVSSVLKGGDDRSREIQRVQKLLVQRLSQGLPTVLQTSRDRLLFTQAQSLAIVQSLGEMVKSPEVRPWINGLFVSGGETMEAVKGALRVFGDEVVGELDESAPWGRFHGGDADGLAVATKAGGLGAPDTLYRFFETELMKPIVFSLGDPLGVSPIVLAKIFTQHREEIQSVARPLIVGNRRILEQALALIGAEDWRVRVFKSPEEVVYEPKTIPILHHGSAVLESLDLASANRSDERIQRTAADLTKRIHDHIYQLANTGRISGWVRGPVNKGRLNRFVDRNFNSMTLDLKQKVHGATQALMILGAGDLKVMVVGKVHQSLRSAIENFSAEAVKEALLLMESHFRQFTNIQRPRVAVASIDPDPHSNDGEIRELNRRASEGIRMAREAGLRLEVFGPVPGPQAAAMILFGQVDAAIGPTHADTHILAKLAAAKMDSREAIPQEEMDRMYREFRLPARREIPIGGWPPEQPLKVLEAAGVRFYLVNDEPMPRAARTLETERTKGDVLQTLRKAAAYEGPGAAFVVMSVNPHAGENGQFGASDADFVGPAIEAAREEGIDVKFQLDETGHVVPWPDDTAVVQALLAGHRSIVAMNRSQAEYATTVLKALEFQGRLSNETKVAGVNVTNLKGFPKDPSFVSAAPDHGTGEAIAWDPKKVGLISEESMLDAYRSVTRMAQANFDRAGLEEDMSLQLRERLRQPLTPEQIQRAMEFTRDLYAFNNLQNQVFKVWLEGRMQLRLDEGAVDVSESLSASGRRIPPKLVKRIFISGKLGGKYGLDDDAVDAIGFYLFSSLEDQVAERATREASLPFIQHPEAAWILDEARAMMTRQSLPLSSANVADLRRSAGLEEDDLDAYGKKRRELIRMLNAAIAQMTPIGQAFHHLGEMFGGVASRQAVSTKAPTSREFQEVLELMVARMTQAPLTAEWIARDTEEITQGIQREGPWWALPKSLRGIIDEKQQVEGLDLVVGAFIRRFQREADKILGESRAILEKLNGPAKVRRGYLKELRKEWLSPDWSLSDDLYEKVQVMLGEAGLTDEELAVGIAKIAKQDLEDLKQNLAEATEMLQGVLAQISQQGASSSEARSRIRQHIEKVETKSAPVPHPAQAMVLEFGAAPAILLLDRLELEKWPIMLAMVDRKKDKDLLLQLAQSNRLKLADRIVVVEEYEDNVQKARDAVSQKLLDLGFVKGADPLYPITFYALDPNLFDILLRYLEGMGIEFTSVASEEAFREAVSLAQNL